MVETEQAQALAKETEQIPTQENVEEPNYEADAGEEETKPLTEEEQRIAWRDKQVKAYHDHQEAKRREEQRLKEEADRVKPLEISEAHANFSLEKKIEADPTIGLPNNRHIICQFCEFIIIPESQATKCQLECDLIQNTLREFDLCDTYWQVDNINMF